MDEPETTDAPPQEITCSGGITLQPVMGADTQEA